MIVDFSNVPLGNYVLGNIGPDEPFGGGVPGVDFPEADPDTTGQILQFNVVPAVAPDPPHPRSSWYFRRLHRSLRRQLRAPWR